MTPPTRRESVLSALVALMLVAQPFLPSFPQSQAFHHLADARTLFGVSNAMDTLSNVAFLLGGAAGLVLMVRRRAFAPVTAPSAMASLTFAGLVTTAAGSAWYHSQLAPDDAGLAIDRLGMVVAFAGILGWASAHRVSERAGWSTGGLVLWAGTLSVWWWTESGNLGPYASLQAFGAVLLALSAWPQRASVITGPSWGPVLLAYTLAKVFESADAQVWHWTSHTVSGHTLKHLVAACAVLPLLAPFRARSANDAASPKAEGG